MAVAVDAVSSAMSAGGAGQVSATHTNMTVGASLSNGALIFGLCWDQTPSAITAFWDSTGTNQAMTQLALQVPGAGQGSVALFGLRNPTSGNKTFSVSWTGAAQVVMFGISFTGVNQTSDAAAFPNATSATNTSTTPSVTITSATGNMPIAIFGDASIAINSVNNTQIFLSSGVNFTNEAMNRVAGASSVTSSATLASSGVWTAAGVDVAAAVAALTLNPMQRIMM